MFQKLIIKLLTVIFRWIHARNGSAKLPAKVSRVAVVCTGGVGDILLCTPAIRAIKETYPQCRVTAIVHHKRIDILRFNPHVDELLPLKKSLFYHARIRRRLKAEPPDAVFFFSANDPFIYCLSYLACRNNLIGLQSDNPLSFLLGEKMELDGQFHIIQNNLNMVSLIGARTENLAMDLYLGEEAKDAAEKFLNAPGKPRFTVGFQLGSGFAGRCWPIPKYAKLGNRLLNELDVRILLLGSPKEKPLVEELNHALNGRAVPAITDLLTVGEIIRNLDALVTPDTGPMHMAFALRCPTVALSGPTNPKNYGPLVNPERHAIIHKVPLDKPFIKLSGDYTDLMNQISSDEVFDAVLDVLRAEPPDRKPAPGVSGEKSLPSL